MSAQQLPLHTIRVIEFTHMVMGPVAGLILADLGAEVIKVEPLEGDKTRNLAGSGAGYFPMYNRNKRSIAIDLKSARGREVALRLIRDADVMVENFRPGALQKLGFDYEQLKQEHPHLVYCSLKGFLGGPYEQRTALDEVAQMMGGLSYMTGPPGQPLRAGASVIDVLGGMFGAIGIQAALQQRQETGRGSEVKSALFESTAFIVGQHMAQYAVSGKPAPPMPARISAWAIYDVFETRDQQQVLVGVVTDGQWRKFCSVFELPDLAADARLATNNGRVAERPRILPLIRELFQGYDKQALMDKLESVELPFAPIVRPDELFADPHLRTGEKLLELELPDGRRTALPALPMNLDGHGFGLRRDPPQIGQHSQEVLLEAGFSQEQVQALHEEAVIHIPPPR